MARPVYKTPRRKERAPIPQKHWRRVMFYQYLQWQIDIQLHRAQQGPAPAIFPSPVFTTWRWPRTASAPICGGTATLCAGLPRGIAARQFSPNGQDWAFPPPNAIRHRETDTAVRPNPSVRTAATAAALRIDHDALFRLYWIPDGFDASTEPTFATSEDCLRILALESVRNHVVVVGEDLGTVEPAVRDTLARFGILSLRVFYFEKTSRGEFRPVRRYRGRRWSPQPPTTCDAGGLLGGGPTSRRAVEPA